MSERTPGDASMLAAPDDERSNCGVGVVFDLAGAPSHDPVSEGLELLENLEHRGTTGADENTGDGAGILLQIPDEFYRDALDVTLPPAREYAVGSVFLPDDDAAAAGLRELVDAELDAHGFNTLAWREVPTENDSLGRTALDAEPRTEQVFVAPERPMADDAFDRRLYEARRAAENRVDRESPAGAPRFYICSLDRKTVVYKGLLKADQLPRYYPELTDERVASTFAMVHARFSTNTLGAWHLAHPYRNIIHNGEFNTIKGNINWMRARETDIAHEDLDVETVKPIIDDPDQSDTASVDNALELLMQGGRELPHALRMLIPEAWRGAANRVPEERQEFYDYHASLVEPWDGPALVCATDGDRIGAVLDRNGLRPCRYDVRDDDTLVMASEAGALDTDPADIRERGRLSPGQLFLVDPEEGRVVPDDEVFDSLTDAKYGEWVADHQLPLSDLAGHDDRTLADPVDDGIRARQAMFGYTHDELDHMLEPMATDGKDPVGSMGDDTPLSVLSEFNRPLFSYFKQLFAQVSNPPLDYIREELVTSMETRLGNQRNLLDETPDHARQVVAESPVFTDAELDAVKGLNGSDAVNGLSTATVDITYDREDDLEAAVRQARMDATVAAKEHDIVVLSDRKAGSERIPIPALLAVGGVHHHLVRNGLRNRVELVLESGGPREVHHIAACIGYGAGAVNPYLAYETVADLVAGPDGADEAEAIGAYIHALEDGVLKTMAKMGISTVESYQGAQIFEAVGLDSDFVAEYFEGTPARTEGIDIDDIERDIRARHAVAYDRTDEADLDLEHQGEYAHRSSGMFHEWNPESVGTLQEAVREGDYEKYGEFAEMMNDQTERLQTLRGLLEFESDRDPVAIEEVEPVESIVTRFNTAPMSLGSLSPEAHENNAIAMNRLGGTAGTGEGGEPPERFDTEKECGQKQVASGRFGVTSEYLTNAEEIQIKMAQGSKPGEGGHLPGEKVNEMIAHVRFSTPGVGLISPPPLHDIYSIEDLKQLIHDLKAANPDADINVKLVAEAGIGTIAAGVAKANADIVHVSGHSGGTGASPKTSIKNAGLPWELGLAEANQMLRSTDLRSRISVSVDGGMKTGRDVAVAALLGAEEYVFGTAPLVTSGCVMARQCHENTCPVGVATQRGVLRERFPGQPDHVINYMTFIAQELREIMAELGYTSVEELVGRAEHLRQRDDVVNEKARKLDLSTVIAPAPGDQRTKTEPQTHETDGLLDWRLLEAAAPALESGEPVHVDQPISNKHRAVGALLSNRISAAYGSDGLPDDSVSVDFTGTAGQSFGAFLAPGVTFQLTGSGNDYVGKGLSGGRIVVNTPADAPYEPENNILIGNVALYGGTRGEAYINGMAGERFAVRNSGVKAVVESVGDHGCEYMTGGVVAVLGETGKNFAAGMSGGVAYVLDRSGDFEEKVNRGMVTVSHDLDERDRAMLRRLVENHVAHTDSDRGRAVLENWEAELDNVVKVMPDAYAGVLADGADDVREELPPRPDAAARAGVDGQGVASSDD
jgi:glutamate synthase (NADPH/NADH) large chain